MFPTALAVAQEKGASGKEFITACVVGYEVACRTGEYLGKTHYQVCTTSIFCFRPSVYKYSMYKSEYLANS